MTVRPRLLLGVFVAVLATPAPGPAHPLGNFSISHYAGLRIAADAIGVRYVIDMAEIPTFQELQDSGIVADEAHAGTAAYARAKAEALGRGLRLEVDRQPLVLAVDSAEVIFPPGVGGLPTLKIAVRYRAALPKRTSEAARELTYRDENLPERAGWKEVIATAGAGATLLSSSVPERDRSRELSDYPTDLLDSPPQVLTARVTFRAGGGTTHAVEPEAPLEANRRGTARDAFTELIATRDLGVGIVLTALAVAAVLGAFHALEPGHGKTVVAAYLVGSRGTPWHAFLLGLIVTASHTAGVFLLGGVTFYASRYIVPERLYPWLGVASGLTIAVLGLVLFVRRYAGANEAHSHAHAHAHGHGHSHGVVGSHTHGDGHHDHEHAEHDEHHESHRPRVPEAAVSLKELFALGLSGGIVPCPAALVVLLSAISLRRVGFGLLLIVAFSVGLAAVLIVIGMVMLYARRLMARFHEESRLVTRWLPLTSSAVITVLGVAIAVQALMSAGILTLRFG